MRILTTFVCFVTLAFVAGCASRPPPRLRDDLVVTPELARYLRENRHPSVVLKLPHIAEESVTQHSNWDKSRTKGHESNSRLGIGLGRVDVGFGSSSSHSATDSEGGGHSVSRMQLSDADRARLEFCDAFERELIRLGFRIRDRKLAESISSGKNFDDYQEMGKLMKVDLIFDISKLEIGTAFNHRGRNVSYNSIDLKVIIARDAAVGGMFSLHGQGTRGRPYSAPGIQESAFSFANAVFNALYENPDAAPETSYYENPQAGQFAPQETMPASSPGEEPPPVD
ncbi:MAG: hypothetical protein LBG65_07535 [Puniceicoccales bacterium]|jgi:hypothetical protein|nr:hypothetical protein [Puniceicoccales bacterium]